MLDVGEQQLLVLLLVMQAELDQVRELGPALGHADAVPLAQRHQRLHALVHLRPVALHLVERGPQDQPAARARVLLAHALVVAVEEHPEALVERHEARFVPFEHEGLEEPGDMRQMPLGRTGIRHRLHLAVLGRERGGECERGGPHLPIALGQCRVG